MGINLISLNKKTPCNIHLMFVCMVALMHIFSGRPIKDYDGLKHLYYFYRNITLVHDWFRVFCIVLRALQGVKLNPDLVVSTVKFILVCTRGRGDNQVQMFWFGEAERIFCRNWELKCYSRNHCLNIEGSSEYRCLKHIMCVGWIYKLLC